MTDEKVAKELLKLAKTMLAEPYTEGTLQPLQINDRSKPKFVVVAKGYGSTVYVFPAESKGEALVIIKEAKREGYKRPIGIDNKKRMSVLEIRQKIAEDGGLDESITKKVESLMTSWARNMSR